MSTPSKDLKKFIIRACEMGAVEAKIIKASSVVTAPWVRMKCQFGCGGYGSSHCCPPRSPTPEETRAVIDCFRRALLIHCREETHPTRVVIKLEREILLSGFYKVLGFGAGPCLLCKQCDLEACKKPDKARPSMEACGIDVFATARANGYPIDVVRTRSCQGNYYGLILID